MRRVLRRAVGAVVLVFLAAVWALTAAQHFGGSSLWWIELARFLPYPLLLVPAAVALGLAWPLGRGWRVATFATLVLVATVGMGLTWGAGAATPAGAPTLRLMTWNAKTVQASERPAGLDALLHEVARQRPDVVVMQDADVLVRRYDAAPSQAMFGLPYVWGAGEYLVASRLPLAGCAQAAAAGLTYVGCTVGTGAAAFELRTLHFDSPRAGLLAARREGAEGIGAWRVNLAGRLAESRAFAASLGGAARPLVIAGDLNAAEASEVVGALLAHGLRDAFSSAGTGYGYTYGHTLRPAFSFLRIDHILVSQEVALRDCFVGTADASDHRPVIADLALPAR